MNNSYNHDDHNEETLEHKKKCRLLMNCNGWVEKIITKIRHINLSSDSPPSTTRWIFFFLLHTEKNYVKYFLPSHPPQKVLFVLFWWKIFLCILVIFSVGCATGGIHLFIDDDDDWRSRWGGNGRRTRSGGGHLLWKMLDGQQGPFGLPFHLGIAQIRMRIRFGRQRLLAAASAG